MIQKDENRRKKSLGVHSSFLSLSLPPFNYKEETFDWTDRNEDGGESVSSHPSPPRLDRLVPARFNALVEFEYVKLPRCSNFLAPLFPSTGWNTSMIVGGSRLRLAVPVVLVMRLLLLVHLVMEKSFPVFMVRKRFLLCSFGFFELQTK